MKLIKKGDREYKIIPEAKMVIGGDTVPFGVISDMESHGTQRLYKRIISFVANMLMIPEVFAGQSFYIDCEITAKAKCTDGDVFSEKVGMDIVSSKLNWKKHMRLARIYDRVHRVLVECMTIACNLCLYHAHKAEAIEEDLKKYYGGVIDDTK